MRFATWSSSRAKHPGTCAAIGWALALALAGPLAGACSSGPTGTGAGTGTVGGGDTIGPASAASAADPDPNGAGRTVEPAPAPTAPGASPSGPASSLPAPAGPVRVGAEVAAADGFATLRGQRVGVILNVASTVDGESLLDVLARADGVDVVAAFAPEHGVRGAAPAGAPVADTTDPATGVPVFSLYGATRAPTAALLAGVDVLVFDLQDVGARPYTYVSTMGLAMQAAADAGVPFVVLDRPNPIGGGPAGTGPVGGWVLEPAFSSFVGLYPIPLAHGLTAGELARMIQGEGWLPGLEALDLHVVAMEHWTRDQRWVDTGRPWVPPSPGLPTPEAAQVYAGTVLFEATSLSVGRGTTEPFTTIGAPWADGDALAAELNRRSLPGVRFDPVRFVPEPDEAVPDPPLRGQDLAGVRVVVTDPAAYRPVETGIHLLTAFDAASRAGGRGSIVSRAEWLDTLAGTDRLGRALASGDPAEDIIATWADDVARFDRARQPYLLY